MKLVSSPLVGTTAAMVTRPYLETHEREERPPATGSFAERVDAVPSRAVA
jgi:hypothetical protein